MMNFRKLFSCILLLIMGASVECAENPKAPNIVLILLDDIGWNTLSIPMDDRVPNSRSDYFQTPNLNRIALAGMRFTQGYASSPICSPTRYAIQFGQSPSKLGRVSNFKDETELIDHESLLSIPKAIKAANPEYVTAHFGKWHMDVMPAVVGYDESDGLTSNVEGLYTGYQTEHKDKFIMKDPKLSYSLSARSADFIERQTREGAPFFLQVSYYANHTNAVCSPEEYAKFSKLEPGRVHSDVHYAAMTADLDNGIGIIMKRLLKLGIESNTYIIVVSDNGAIPGFPPKPDAKVSFNYPLKMGKWNVYEGGIRIPFFIKGPGIEAGSMNHTPVITHDLLPTISSLVDPSAPIPDIIEGISLHPMLFNNETDPDRLIVVNLPFESNWEMRTPSTSLRKGDHKIIKYLEKGRIELFDLSSDISEQHDLSAKMPKKAQELNGKLDEYFQMIEYTY